MILPARETYLRLRRSLQRLDLFLVLCVLLDNSHRILGPPSEETWPNAVKLPDYKVTKNFARVAGQFSLFIPRSLHPVSNYMHCT